MKVVLLENVSGRGYKGDVIEVNDGYARNVLIKQKKAVELTKAVMKQLADEKQANQTKYDEKVHEAENFAKQIIKDEFIFSLKVGPNGKTFGTVSAKQIADMINNKYKSGLTKKNINVDHDLNSLGTHEINVKLHPEVIAQIKVMIKEQK
jgi:large subunit ribosomal protein L9